MTTSVRKTGRLIVAAEDRAFAGFVRSIQGHVVQELPGTPTKALGQKNVPGIAQSVTFEDAVVLTRADLERAARELVSAPATASAGPSGWSFAPPRYFVS